MIDHQRNKLLNLLGILKLLQIWALIWSSLVFHNNVQSQIQIFLVFLIILLQNILFKRNFLVCIDHISGYSQMEWRSGKKDRAHIYIVFFNCLLSFSHQTIHFFTNYQLVKWFQFMTNIFPENRKAVRSLITQQFGVILGQSFGKVIPFARLHSNVTSLIVVTLDHY